MLYLFFRVTALLGYQPQELLGKSAFDFYHPEDKTHMKDTFEQGIVIWYCKRVLINKVFHKAIKKFILHTPTRRINSTCLPKKKIIPHKVTST